MIYVCTSTKECEYFHKEVYPRMEIHYSYGNIPLTLIYLSSNKDGIIGNAYITNMRSNHKLPGSTVKDIVRNAIASQKYDALAYCGHSSGYVFGPDKHVHFTILELCSWLRQHGPVKVIAFDACYCGTVECLYELHGLTKYILAAPSYHDDSILVTPSLYVNNKNLKKYLQSIVEDFPENGDPKMSLRLSLIDVNALPPLVGFLQKNNEKLSWTSCGIIHKSDPQLHHICNAATGLSKTLQDRFQQLLSKVVLTTESCKDCKLYGPEHVCLGIYMEIPAEEARNLSYYKSIPL